MGASGADFNYRVALARSRLAAAGVVIAGAATFALLLSLRGDVLPKLAAALWVGYVWFKAYRAVGLQAGARGARELVIRADRIDVHDGDGEWREGQLRAGSFVSPGLTIVRWRPQRALFDRTILILPGMVPADDFRLLRVLLRWR